MKQIEQTYTIKAPVAKVWEALTDAAVAEEWGAGPAKVDAKEGGKFSYWGGNIYGVNTKVIPEKLLEQDWCSEDYPGQKYKITFSFEAADAATKVHLVQTGVQDDDVQDFTDGWRSYYFDPITALLEEKS